MFTLESLMKPEAFLAAAIIGALLALVLGYKWGTILAALGLVAMFFTGCVASRRFAEAFVLAGFALLPIFASSLALGILAGALLRRRRFILGPLLFIPFVIFIWSHHAAKNDEEEVKREGARFVSTEKHLVKLMGGPVDATLYMYAGGPRGPITRLEYSVKGRGPMFAIVDVKRDRGTLSFKLACVTTVYVGQRVSGKDDCEQSPIELPQVP